MRIASTFFVLLTLVTAGTTHVTARTGEPAPRRADGHVAGPHVRGASPRMSELLEVAAKRSRTFASLVKQLDQSDVIVHVEEVRSLPTGVDGRLSFVLAAGGVRYLRAQVLMGRGVVDTMSVVGHELQHAVEVAMRKGVRCEKTFTSLYLQIGDHPAAPDRFDTPAAREAGRRVRNELS